MTILIRANNNLQTSVSTVQSVTEYTTFDLVLLLPSVQASAVLYSWISPVNTRFAERAMQRTPAFDEEGLYAYAATIYPVMTAGIPAQQTTGVALVSFRIGAIFSPIVKIPVDKSILPEQTELPLTAVEELQQQIDELVSGDPFDEDGTYPNLRAQATTKGDVELGSVENYGIATKAEAEAGSVNNKYMTPLRTKEAILELAPETDLTAINAHIADNDIHFEQSAISITESQISDLGDYEPANENIQAHIEDTTVHFTQANISITENQISDFGSYEPANNNIQAHIANNTVHFTQEQISITADQISDLGSFEPAFTKNTAFNKNFGTTSGTVAEGNHTHTEADITDLDKYSVADANNTFMAIDDYVDANDKILFSKLPDGAKSQTYVVATFQDLPVSDLLSGDKGYITTTGDSYIWDGNSWEVLADADWENVSLDWANITNKPVGTSNSSLANGVLYTKTETDTLLNGKANTSHTHTKAEITDFAHTHTKSEITDFAHTHVEADITDLNKYTTQEVDDLLDGKSDVGHTHVKADITDFAHNHDDLYYTETELDNGQLDNRYYTETEVNEFLDLNYRKQLYPNTKNTSGSTILKGTVVQFAGSQGDFILIKNAVPAEIISNPETLMGLAEDDILDDEFGNVVWFGNVINVIIDPALFQNGDILYFDNTTGGLTKTAPAENKIIVAAVEKVSTAAQATNGILLVRPKWVSRDINQIDGLQGELNAINNTIGDIETILDSILGV